MQASDVLVRESVLAADKDFPEWPFGHVDPLTLLFGRCARPASRPDPCVSARLLIPAQSFGL